MRRIIIFLLIVISLTLTPTAGASSPQLFTDRQSELLDIFNSAEQTIRRDGNYSRALEQYLAFIRGAESDAKLERQLLTAYISVAVIYGSFNDTDNAITYNKLAYPLAKKLGNREFTELALTNLGQSYKDKHNFAAADRTADRLMAECGRVSHTASFHYSIIKGETAHLQNLHSDALRHFRNADSIARRENLSSYEQSAPLSLIAEHYRTVGKPDSQLVYLNRSWALLEDSHDPQPKTEIARSLMILHTRLGNLAEARRFQDIYFGLTDSLVNPVHFLSVSTHDSRERIAAKGTEIELLNRTASLHRLIIGITAAFLILTLIFLYFILRQKRNVTAAYKALYEKDRRLMALHDKTEQPCDTSDGCDNDTQIPDNEQNRDLYNRIVSTIESSAEYLNADFGLSNIVTAVGSNATYVSRVVKRYSGQNVPSFINEYRVREACRRLLDDKYGNLTFGAIGESVGFSSQVSFNRTFKKVTGLTPSLYRKMAEADRKKSGPELDSEL